MKRILLALTILCLILGSCGQETKTVIEDLSVATSVEVTDDAQGSSYVKLAEQNTTTEEISEEEMNTLEKKVYREGDFISLEPVGTDPDGDVITYTYSNPLSDDGTWQTVEGDAGTYLVTITASDGKVEVEKKVVLLVLSANRAPTIEGLEDLTVAEGDLVALHPKVFDYNGDEVKVEYSKPFNEDGEWQTGYEDSGTYLVKISVSDNITTTEERVTIVVTDANRAPVFEAIEPITANAGELITIDPSAADADGDNVTYAFSAPVAEDGTWQTTEEDEGTYEITITASDGKNKTTQGVTIVLNHKNKAPVISLDAITATETDLITLQPTIVDPEGDTYTVTYSEPFSSAGTWQTDYDDAGEYTVVITATDSQGAVSTEEVPVKVTDKNRAPVFRI